MHAHLATCISNTYLYFFSHLAFAGLVNYEILKEFKLDRTENLLKVWNAYPFEKKLASTSTSFLLSKYTWNTFKYDEHNTPLYNFIIIY